MDEVCYRAIETTSAGCFPIGVRLLLFPTIFMSSRLPASNDCPLGFRVRRPKDPKFDNYLPTMCSMPLLFSMQTNSSISASGSSRGWRTIRHGFV